LGDLRATVDAVAEAVAALQAAPDSVAALSAVDQAAASAAVLEQDLTAEVLQRLVIHMQHCHRAGLADSPTLAASCRAVRVALLLDPRWLCEVDRA
jgi:precorrin-4 methylase